MTTLSLNTMTTLNTATPSIGSPTSAPTNRARRLPRLLQLVAGLAVALTSLVAVSAHEADAALVGPDPIVNVAGSIGAELYCSPGRVGITAYTSVQSHYVNGQYVRWQYYLSNTNGWGQYSNWSADNLVRFKQLLQQWLGTAYRTAVSGTTWNASVRVAYWNGSSWFYSGWVTAGKKMQGYSDWQRNCWT